VAVTRDDALVSEYEYAVPIGIKEERGLKKLNFRDEDSGGAPVVTAEF
jgi:hypothetical protein